MVVQCIHAFTQKTAATGWAQLEPTATSGDTLADTGEKKKLKHKHVITSKVEHFWKACLTFSWQRLWFCVCVCVCVCVGGGGVLIPCKTFGKKVMKFLPFLNITKGALVLIQVQRWMTSWRNLHGLQKLTYQLVWTVKNLVRNNIKGRQSSISDQQLDTILKPTYWELHKTSSSNMFWEAAAYIIYFPPLFSRGAWKLWICCR